MNKFKIGDLVSSYIGTGYVKEIKQRPDDIAYFISASGKGLRYWIEEEFLTLVEKI